MRWGACLEDRRAYRVRIGLYSVNRYEGIAEVVEVVEYFVEWGGKASRCK